MNTSDSTSATLALEPRREVVAWMRRVSRYFDNAPLGRALNEISFEVLRGEVFGLLGPIGSGKSTTIRILAGRLSPSAGKAGVFGRRPRSRSARRRVGYLPQWRSHNQSYLVAKAMGFLRALLIRRREPPRPAPVGITLGSERRRILRQLLLKQPELLLLDEPFAGLDAAAGVEMKELILESARRGQTIILASDSLTHAKDVCDRFAVYNAGIIEAIGTLDQILGSPSAIRSIGPVLPRQTAQRVLEVLCTDLVQPAPEAELSRPTSQGQPPIAPPLAVAGEASTEATPDDFLAPLVATPWQAAPNDVPQPGASPVNFERLAALTKPDSAAPSGAPDHAT